MVLPLLQHKGDFQDNLVAVHLAVVDGYLLLLHPRAPHVLECLARACDALLDGILEACRTDAADLRNASDRHGETPWQGKRGSRLSLTADVNRSPWMNRLALAAREAEECR